MHIFPKNPLNKDMVMIMHEEYSFICRKSNIKIITSILEYSCQINYNFNLIIFDSRLMS